MIQSQILNVIRTGDPVIDAVLASILLTLLTYIAAQRKIIIDFIKHRITRKRCIMHVPSSTMRCHDSVLNRKYTDLTWFLTERVDLKNTRAIKSYRYDEVSKSIPNDGNTVRYRFQNDILSIWHKTDEVRLTDKIFTKHEICVSGRSTQILQNFMQYVEEERTISLNKSVWSQLIYSTNISTDGAYWQSSRTNNTKTLRTVVLRRDQHERLQKDLDSFLNAKDRYNRMGVAWTRGYLLTGAPGCGKTSLIKAISEHANMHIFNLNLSLINTDAQLEILFRSIPDRSIVLIEDIDCMTDIIHRRTEASSKKQISETAMCLAELVEKQKTFTLSGLLNQVDGITCGCGRIFIMTSNHPEKIDPALLRPGRIDMTLDLQPCTPQQTSDFFKLFFEEHLQEDVLEHIPSRTPAEVSNICLSHLSDKDEAIKAIMQKPPSSAPSWVLAS